SPSRKSGLPAGRSGARRIAQAHLRYRAFDELAHHGTAAGCEGHVDVSTLALSSVNSRAREAILRCRISCELPADACRPARRSSSRLRPRRRLRGYEWTVRYISAGSRSLLERIAPTSAPRLPD